MPSIFHPFYCQTIIHHSCEYRFIYTYVCMFSSVQSLSHVWLFATPWTAAYQASLSISNSQSLLKLMFIESVIPSNHLTSVTPFSFCLQSFPASGSFQMSQFLPSALEFQLQHQSLQWIFPLGLTASISLQSKGLPRVFSKITLQKHQLLNDQLDL